MYLDMFKKKKQVVLLNSEAIGMYFLYLYLYIFLNAYLLSFYTCLMFSNVNDCNVISLGLSNF